MLGITRRTMCLSLGAAVARPVLGAKPWERKPIAEWSERDIESILSASPWARAAIVPIHLWLADGVPSGRQGTSGESSEAIDEHRTLQYLVRWDSARPVQEALRLTRKRGPVYAPISSEAAEKYYILSVIILRPDPVDSGHFEVDTDHRNRIIKLSMLRRVRHADLHPCEVVGKRGHVLYQLRFLKEDPITPEDGHVEFSTQAVPSPLRLIFPLDEMFFQGKLAV